jgi:hypothetical protein
MRTQRILAVAAAFALGLAACENQPLALDIDGEAADQLEVLFSHAAANPEVRSASSGGGSVFDVLNARIAGFAGIYRSVRCSVVLRLTGAADAAEAVRITAAVINPLVGRSCPRGISITAERAAWTYDELVRIHTLARPLLGSPAVLQVTLNLPGNVVQIVVQDGQTARRVFEFLAGAGVPEGAFSIRVRGDA